MSDVTMTAQDYPVSAIPWPQAVDWSHRELQRYLDAAADPDIQALATRCPPWSVADLSAHLAASFRRFADQLEKARSGSLAAPFPPDELSRENLRAVRDFHGDPLGELAAQAGRFLGAVDTVDEMIGHQFGPIPVGLQVMFGLVELTVHHDDLANATGSCYRPAGDVVEAMAHMYGAVFGMPAGADPWKCLLRATGR